MDEAEDEKDVDEGQQAVSSWPCERWPEAARSVVSCCQHGEGICL